MSNSYKSPASPENLYQHIRNRYNNKRVICAYEVGVTGYHLPDYLTSKNIRCLMVPPPSIPKASNDRTKNNRLDSERISQHLKNGDMLPIRVPDYDCRELRQLLRSREEYVAMRKTAKQRIKSLLLFSNLHILLNPNFSLEARNRRILCKKSIQVKFGFTPPFLIKSRRDLIRRPYGQILLLQNLG